MPTQTRRRFFVTALAAAFAPAAQAKGPGISTNRAGLAIQGYDTSAYWLKGTPQLGLQSHAVTWQGTPWHFATQTDADAFAANPARYAPKFGGFCTRAMSLKKVVDGDPEVWRIFEERLYLFARPVGGTYFDKGPAAMIAKAQAHWDKLTS